MRLATEHRVLQVEPGSTVDVDVDVVNTGELIDGVSAHVLGLPEATVVVEPQLLPLFPGATGRIRLSIAVPGTLRAGSHPITVEAVSHGTGAPTQHLDLDLSVSAHPAVRLHRTPRTIRSRRAGRFLLEVENPGNTALDVTLSASLEDGRSTVRFNPRSLRVQPGARTPVIAALKGPRMVTGAEVDRTATVDLTASRTHSIPAMTELEAETLAAADGDTETERAPDLTAQTSLVLRQRPMVSRGLLTALILLGIVGLWASVFLLGLTQVFAGDPVTKTAVPTMFVTDYRQVADGGSPPGTLAKTGIVPPGVGGTVSGTVVASSNGAPVGRILVKAYRDGKDGPVLVSSAATQADGTYTLAGLFPTDYRLEYAADGFTKVWYRFAKGRGAAERVSVAPGGTTDAATVTVAGKPASISGTVDEGSALADVPTTVTARALDVPSSVGVVATDVTDASGSYTLADLPAPATYELSFSAEGYETKTLTTTVNGGEQRSQPSVVPSSDSGVIGGTVRDTLGNAVGGVTISTTVNGQAVSVITPTVGSVGAFTLGDLPTPGTYVLTFGAEGYGSTTEIVDLEAGESDTSVAVEMSKGTGSLSGRLLAPDGTGVGGATLTVGGAQTTTGTDGTPVAVPTTTTLTAGEVGSFSLNGLAAPGDYTLTFTAEGYAPTTVPVRLEASGQPPELTVQLDTKLGSVAGVVRRQNGSAVQGAVVTITNGSGSWSATTGGPGSLGGAGGFEVADLPPGTYSVTARADGLAQRTAIVTVVPGVTSDTVLELGPGG
ncbi:carboxypeptidase regulatory-like domain-containing protein [Nocardioides litoris]|uniref:carboxypeptidase regulatory-like domain-containing protein n=1 Tax=Nocardioides litoris TaxID=1926648 RepID=UPI00111F2D27|nr:carboxypeptidase regulatory-like domain-containing protein [Nocardioides litoris]